MALEPKWFPSSPKLLFMEKSMGVVNAINLMPGSIDLAPVVQGELDNLVSFQRECDVETVL